MQSSDDPGADIARRDAPLPAAAPHLAHAETREVERVAPGAVRVPPAPAPPAAPAELAGLLLPTEHVAFATAPHAIVLLPPLVRLAVVVVAAAVALAWKTHPIVHGHHVVRPLIAGPGRHATLAVAGLIALGALASFARRLWFYVGHRIVCTNRRVFVVDGVLGRRVRPLGMTALAGARLAQGVVGRALGFGTIVLGDATAALTSGGAFVAVRDPIGLYRACEAVANGVEGETWSQPVRQVHLP